jgi:hypothetical protein
VIAWRAPVATQNVQELELIMRRLTLKR